MNTRELMSLKMEWNRKLKDSGFQDIEMWDSFKIRNSIKFIRSHIRWDMYKTKENFLNSKEEYSNYFRVLGIYAHHGPMPLKYKDIIIEYGNTGSIPQAIKNIKSTVAPTAVYNYLQRNLNKMITFVNELDRDCIDERD